MVDRIIKKVILFISFLKEYICNLLKSNRLENPDNSWRRYCMDAKSVVLAALAPAEGGVYSPVQVQKLIFILNEEIPKQFDGPHFNFEPYDYGPFDKKVYETLEALEKEGLVEIIRERWNSYKLTPAGQARGNKLVSDLNNTAMQYLINLSKFVRSLSFSELVSAVYKAYPKMKENSVFQG